MLLNGNSPAIASVLNSFYIHKDFRIINPTTTTTAKFTTPLYTSYNKRIPNTDTNM